MKKFKLIFFPIVVCVMALIIALTACGGAPFVNPGDKLGGGGTGDIADSVNDSAVSSVKKDIIANSDLSALASDTDSAGATEIAATSDVVEITQSGSYYFQGSYGGIHIAGEKLKLHFFLDGANISTENGVAIDGTSDAKKLELVITLAKDSSNVVCNSGLDKKGKEVNAIHIKGSLAINGTGTLSVVSESKSALKASKGLQIVDSTLKLEAANHAVSALFVVGANCTVEVMSAGKDGINAECDDETTAFTTDEGYVSLTNVNYNCNVPGDGIQADTVVYINGGTYHITTSGNFVQKSSANMSEYGMTADDFNYTKSGNDYARVASDEVGRYGSNLYGLSQSCKGIKAGEIEYPDPKGGDDEITVSDGDYLIVITAGSFTIDSTDDAIHTNGGDVLIEGGTYTLSTCDDAITADGLNKITGGDITIAKSYEGIEGAYVEISGGTIDLTASDDGINAASDDRSVTAHIIISGGDITVNASGDGIDSNGSILISGGRVIVYGPTSGRDAGLDADRGIVITGGYVFATSTLGMVETPSSNSTQYVVSYAHQSTITAGSVISLADSNGDMLFSCELLKNCQSVIFSTPDLVKGGSYTLYGGSTKLTTFTVSSIITTIGSAGGSFPGGRPGGTPPGGFGGR